MLRESWWCSWGNLLWDKIPSAGVRNVLWGYIQHQQSCWKTQIPIMKILIIFGLGKELSVSGLSSLIKYKLINQREIKSCWGNQSFVSFDLGTPKIPAGDCFVISKMKCAHVLGCHGTESSNFLGSNSWVWLHSASFILKDSGVFTLLFKDN